MTESHPEDPARLMAGRLDFGLTGPVMQGLIPETGGFEALCHPTGKVWCAASHVDCRESGMRPEELQEFLWQQFFADPPSQWWDNRRSKPTARHPDFRHKKSKVALWLDNRHKPAWVDSQLATWDAGMKVPGVSMSTAVRVFGREAATEDQLEVGMCRKLCEDGRISDAVDALHFLVHRASRHVDNNIFYRVLKRAQKDLDLGRRIHALAIKSGYEGDAFLATHLIGLYASHGELGEAMGVFTKVSTPSAYNWATIIFAYARHGEAAQAIRLYGQMRESTAIEPTDRIYVAVLKACAAAGDLVAGKEVHAQILATGKPPNMFVQTGLVDMYAKCGSLEDARSVFDGLSERDVVSWTAMIAGYAQHGMGQEALALYNSMQQEGLSPPVSSTYVCLLQACASVGVGALHQGKQLHAQLEERGLKADAVLGGSLVNMYAKCGSLEDARRVFDRLPDRNVVAWNAMLAGYARQGMSQEALALYTSMQQEGLTPPSPVTFVCLLQACARVGVGALHQGKQLHAQAEARGLQNNGVVGTCLVDMYAKCGSVEDARRVFDTLSERDVVTWTAMIAGYAQQGMGQEALGLYSSMQQECLTPPSPVTFGCLLQACASVGVGALDQGKQVHAEIEAQGLQDYVGLGGSLVNMYAKCSSLEDARSVFDKLPDRNVLTWNAMLTAYVQHGMGQEAVSLCSSMHEEGIAPDSITFVCLLQACAIVAALPLGKQLHSKIEERGLQADPVVGAALVNMYAKCGSMFDSQQVFDSLPERSIEAWGALTSGYSRQGDSEVVFQLVDRMRLEGIQPDSVTFLSVLTVCSHGGLVDKGRKYFAAIVSPIVEHYICMMDLLGRAGHLDEALRMANTMPVPPNSTVWHTLLGACVKWNNVEIGQQAFEFAVSADRTDAASYVLMSNIYARAQMWEEAKEMQARRKKLGAWKKPGQSWCADIGGVVHTFVVGDKKHPEIEGRPDQLVPQMEEGYLPTSRETSGDSKKLSFAYARQGDNRLTRHVQMHVISCRPQSLHHTFGHSAL